MSNVFYAPYPSASPFYFDIEYNNINENELQQKASTDGVFVGRFILTEYTNEPTNDMHEVVWQKVFEDNALSYKKVARIGMDGAIEQLQAQWDEVYSELTQEKINAQNSAQAANESAKMALNFQEAAEYAKNQAQEYAGDALDFANNAKQYEDNASASAKAAQEAKANTESSEAISIATEGVILEIKSTVEAAEIEAKTSASNAAVYAQNALAREQEIDAMLASKELTIFWNDYL